MISYLFFNHVYRAAEGAGMFRGRRPLYTNGKLDPATEGRDLPGLGRVDYATGRDIRTEADLNIQLTAPAIPQWRGYSTVPGEIYPKTRKWRHYALYRS